jgi:hypothetical protein
VRLDITANNLDITANNLNIATQQNTTDLKAGGGDNYSNSQSTKHQGCQNRFFLFILKVANIRCFILIKCSEQEARFKKYAIMS